jgi:hypothetical protein
MTIAVQAACKPGNISGQSWGLTVSALSTLHQMQGNLQQENGDGLPWRAEPAHGCAVSWQHQLLFGHLTSGLLTSWFGGNFSS